MPTVWCSRVPGAGKPASAPRIAFEPDDPVARSPRDPRAPPTRARARRACAVRSWPPSWTYPGGRRRYACRGTSAFPAPAGAGSRTPWRLSGCARGASSTTRSRTRARAARHMSTRRSSSAGLPPARSNSRASPGSACAPRTRAPPAPQLPQVRAPRVARPDAVGLARARAAPRSADASARLDVLAAGSRCTSRPRHGRTTTPSCGRSTPTRSPAAARAACGTRSSARAHSSSRPSCWPRRRPDSRSWRRCGRGRRPVRAVL